jgi:hypothetical protein
MSKVFNLSEIVTEAAEAEGGSGDLIVPTSGETRTVTVKYVKVTPESQNFGLPEFWCIMTDDEAEESFGFKMNFTSFDFVNKLTVANLKALGVTDDMFNSFDPEVVGAMIKDKRVVCKVKWGANKKKPEYPFQNHTLHAIDIVIPEADDDDDDY